MIAGFLFAAIIAAFMVIFLNRRIYCFIFEHDDWKLWKYFISDANNIKFKDVSYLKDGTIVHFDYCGRYDIIMWYPYMYTDVTVHTYDNNCILCNFDKYHSKIMYNILIEKIPDDIKVMLTSVV